MLCGAVGAPLVALDVPVPFVFPLSSLLFPLCAMVPTLLVGSVVVVPLSLPAVADCGGVVYSVLGLWSPGLESVPVAPVELEDLPPRLLVSGGGCVWCATWPCGTGKGPGYPSRLVSRFRCVFRCTAVFCFSVSRRVSRDLS